MLSVYPGMSLDFNYSQAVPATHGFPRAPAVGSSHHHRQLQQQPFYPSKGVDPEFMATFPTTATDGTILQQNAFEYTATSAGATHATQGFIASPPFIPQLPARTLASVSPQQGYAFHPSSEQHHLQHPPQHHHSNKMRTPYLSPHESGLSVDPCVYSSTPTMTSTVSTHSSSNSSNTSTISSNSTNDPLSCPSRLAGPAAYTPPPAYHPYFYAGKYRERLAKKKKKSAARYRRVCLIFILPCVQVCMSLEDRRHRATITTPHRSRISKRSNKQKHLLCNKFSTALDAACPVHIRRVRPHRRLRTAARCSIT